MSVLAIIPARKGSKRLPGKNLELVGGETLIDRALGCGWYAGVGAVALTTDYPRLVSMVDRMHFDRPAHLATDTARIEDVLVDVLDHLDEEPELVVLLNPTSPLRRPETVKRCIERARECNGSAVTVVRVRDPHLHAKVYGSTVAFADVPDRPWTRSQDASPLYRIHGAAFVTRPSIIRAGRLVAPPCAAVETDWREAIDIDTEDDLWLARAVVEGYPALPR
jgi:CMP-N-acetylneuraminic acid synthetase